MLPDKDLVESANPESTTASLNDQTESSIAEVFSASDQKSENSITTNYKL